MTASRPFKDLERPISKNFLEALFKDGVDKTASEMRTRLDDMQSTKPLNPGRTKEFTWDNKDLSSNLKDVLVIGTALDQEYSEAYTTANDLLLQSIAALSNPKYNIVQLEKKLADQLLTEHVQRESKEVQYHRDPHPNESAGIASKIVLTNTDGSAASTPEEQARAASTFAIHDSEYGEMADGLNEINSAAVHYEAKVKAYEDLKSQISNDSELGKEEKENAIIGIDNYIKMLAYECWKSVVSGTTMMKKIDGQPTIFTVQKLVVEDMLGLPTPTTTALDRQTMVMSMVDSNFAGFVKQLQNDSEMKKHLPSSLLGDIPPKIQAILFNPPDTSLDTPITDKTTIDTAGLLYGQNERMFPEIHIAYKAALFQASFDVTEGGEIVKKDGVTLWNEAMEAARLGETDKLKELLTATTTNRIEIKAFPPGSAPSTFIEKRATLQDIFIHRIGSEIMFARQQGTEMYKLLADKLGLKQPDIQYEAWKEHATRLENLRDRYNACDPKDRFEVSKALFHIASHQPGVFLDSEKRMENITHAKSELDKQKSEVNNLQRESNILTVDIFVLEEKINGLKKAQPSPPTVPKETTNTTSSIRQRLRTQAGGISAEMLNDASSKMHQKQAEQAAIETKLKALPNLEQIAKKESNLWRTQQELQAIRPRPVTENAMGMRS